MNIFNFIATLLCVSYLSVIHTEVPVCFGLSGDESCSGTNGQCVFDDGNPMCLCEDNFGGEDCSIGRCYGLMAYVVNVCSGNGNCQTFEGDESNGGVRYADCVCFSDWDGPQCDIPKCDRIPASNSLEVCNGNGQCELDHTCTCQAGFGGDYCDSRLCNGKHRNDPTVCSGNGNCNDGRCACSNPNNWGGDNCEVYHCSGVAHDAPGVCSDNGVCMRNHECLCDNEWGGSTCSLPVCYGIVASNEDEVCSGNGFCDPETHTCVCYPTFEGVECDLPIEESVEGTPFVVSATVSAVVFVVVFAFILFLVILFSTFCAVRVIKKAERDELKEIELEKEKELKDLTGHIDVAVEEGREVVVFKKGWKDSVEKEEDLFDRKKVKSIMLTIYLHR